MKPTPPSFLAVLLSLAIGLFAGRSLFPKLDDTQIADLNKGEFTKAYDQRTSSGSEMIKACNDISAKLASADEKQCEMLWTAVAGEAPSSVKAARLHWISEFAKLSNFAGWPAFLAARESDSPWWRLEKGDFSEAKGAPGRIGAGGELNLRKLREEHAKATDPVALVKTAEAVGLQFGKIDPAGAVSWMETLPAAEHVGAAAGIARAWGESEPFEATIWLVKLPEGPVRDAASAGFAMGAGDVDPMLALPWALQVSDSALRIKSVDRVLRAAAKISPETALDYLRQAGLPGRERVDYEESLVGYVNGTTNEP